MVQSLSCVRLSETLQSVAPRLLCLWDPPGKNTGAGCLSLLQGIFPTQGSNPRPGGLFSTEPPGKPRKGRIRL